MAIQFKCPHCQTGLEARDDLAGQKGSCPKCGKSIDVPKSNLEAQTKPKESEKKE
jgi:DNA-directed RNA polymerase subunit M/transcription elongation factor TFIIS